MRKQYIHYSLVLQARSLSHALYQTTRAAISNRPPERDIKRLLAVHAKTVQRFVRRSDRYNRFNAYCYGFYA